MDEGNGLKSVFLEIISRLYLRMEMFGFLLREVRKLQPFGRLGYVTDFNKSSLSNCVRMQIDYRYIVSSKIALKLW